MAAFLQLSADTDLTLGDIEAWAARARALGATPASPVRFGDDQPLPGDGKHPLMLSVPVVVTRTILPGDAPEPRPDPEAGDEPEPGHRRPERQSQPARQSDVSDQRDLSDQRDVSSQRDVSDQRDVSGERDVSDQRDVSGQGSGRRQRKGPELGPATFSSPA